MGFTTQGFLNPLLINGIRLGGGGRAPRRGEHTISVLRDLGFSDYEINELIKDGVVGV